MKNKVYKITDNLSINIDENGNYKADEASSLLAIICGLEHDLEASQAAANVFTAADGTRYWVPKSIDGDFTEYAELQLFNPFKNPAIAQTLMRQLGITLNPVAFENGNLTGQWRAEYVIGYGSSDFHRNGWPFGVNEPVFEQSHDVKEAVCKVAMRVVGFLRRAYLLERENESRLIFLSDWVYEWIIQNSPDGATLTPIEELDEYAICSVSQADAARIIEASIRDSDAAAADAVSTAGAAASAKHP